MDVDGFSQVGQDLFIDRIHAALQVRADALQNRSAAAS